LGGDGGLGGSGGGSGWPAGEALDVLRIIGSTKLIREPPARFRSAEPDNTRSASEELRASSLTRELGPIVARLPSVKWMVAGALDVATSSPATTGKDATAVTGTAFPFNVSGPEPMTLPTGPAAIATPAEIIRMTRHKYFIDTSCESLSGKGFARFHHNNFAA
jgi:hypothetical protein